jgi:serine phosphatase RsbU (regulator of sigma subunit)
MIDSEWSDDAAAGTAAARMFTGLLADGHLSTPDEVAAIVAANAAPLGVSSVVIYLVNYEQTDLIPVPGPHSVGRSVLRMEGTLAGRAFVTVRAQDVEAVEEPKLRRLWLPLVDGTERLGVLELLLPGSDDGVPSDVLAVYERYAHMVAQLVLAKGLYGDTFESVRRSRPMTVAAELQWTLLPPLTFATDGFALSGMLEPSYSVGGDSFDYAVDQSVAHLAVFDAMGHGLTAALAAAVAVSTYRNARRRSLDLVGSYGVIDDAVAAEFGDSRYVTAVLARLDLHTGALSWISAGHPPPLLLRSAHGVRPLELATSTPLGWQLRGDPPPVGHAHLQPGDRVLFYTDGLTEARTSDGAFFTVERLAEFLERQAAAGFPAPETLRRLRHAVLAHQHGALQDDATALLVEWRRGTEEAMVPDTVRGRRSHGGDAAG